RRLARPRLRVAASLLHQCARWMRARPVAHACGEVRAGDEALGERRESDGELQHQRVSTGLEAEQPGALHADPFFVLRALAEHEPAIVDGGAARYHLVVL